MSKEKGGVSKKRLNEIIAGFLEYAHSKKFVLDEKLAQVPGNHLLLAPQVFAAKEVITRVFLRKRAVFNLSIVRQLGKTEIVALIVSYIFKTYFKEFGEPFRVVVVAPEKNTGLLVFDRIVDYVPTGFFNKKQAGSHYETKDGDFIDVFSMYDKRVGGTYEGRTINMVVRDEAHLGDDEKYKDQIRPTMIRTNGVVINIGNGSWRECLFTKGIAMGNTVEKMNIGGFEYETENVVIQRTYDDLKDYMTDLASRGNRESATWLAGVESDLMDGGRKSLENRKNIFCEVILEKENFITVQEFDACLVEPVTHQPSESVAMIDIAKSIDRTVAGFMDMNYTIFDTKILKESFERKDILQQLDEFVEYCDDMEYTEKLEAVAGDATGMGETAIEALSISMEREIIPMKFSLQSKHKWYMELQSRILTTNPVEKLKIPKNLRNLDKLRTELTGLEIKSSMNGDCLMFAAPNKKDCFDDFAAVMACIVDVVGRIRGRTKSTDTYDSRFPRKIKSDKARSNRIILPSEKRKNTGSRISRMTGEY